MRRLIVVLTVALLGCDSPSSTDEFDVSGSWGAEGANNLPQCSFYAALQIAGNSQNFQGTALLETAESKKTVTASLIRNRLTLNGFDLIVTDRPWTNNITGTFQCGGQQGQWSMYRYP